MENIIITVCQFFFFFYKKKSMKKQHSEFSSLGPFVCQLNKMEDFKKKHSFDIKWPRLYNVQRMDEASSWKLMSRRETSNIFHLWHVDVSPAVNANRNTMSYHGCIIAICVAYKLFTDSVDVKWLKWNF